MCIRVERSFSNVNEVKTPIDMSSFMFDEIGLANSTPFEFDSIMPVVAIYFRGQTISYQDLCEDG